MPGGVPRTSTLALNNATLPFLRKIANDGYKQDIESFMSQLSLDGKTLTRGTIYKHINILKQILELADVEVSFPKIRGAKKQVKEVGSIFRTIRLF